MNEMQAVANSSTPQKWILNATIKPSPKRHQKTGDFPCFLDCKIHLPVQITETLASKIAMDISVVLEGEISCAVVCPGPGGFKPFNHGAMGSR